MSATRKSERRSCGDDDNDAINSGKNTSLPFIAARMRAPIAAINKIRVGHIMDGNVDHQLLEWRR